MSWKPEDYSGYSFSEYQPSPKAEADNYTDPRFYQPLPEAGKVPQFAPPPPVHAPQAPNWSSGGEVPAHMSEYRGPASLDAYTNDVGAEQRAAASRGTVEGQQKRRFSLANLGSLGAIIALLAKFGLASITAVISVAIYAQLFGWTFAIGLVALLFIHEMGHAVVMKLKGLPVGGMVFIPMLGAAVFMNRMPKNAKDEAEVGIAGPVAGALASSVCLLLAFANPDSAGIWASLAYFGFFMNLFNLIPIVPFDGGRVLAAIDRRIWIIGFIGLVAVQIWEWVNGTGSIWLLIFIVMAATQLFTRTPNTPEARAYYSVPLGERVALGLAYFGLAAVLVLGMSLTRGLMPFPQ